MQALSDLKIIDSWERNAEAWILAVRNGEIASRQQVTDSAILEVIQRHSPSKVLDIGCGEGWLVRALCAKGVDSLGIDAVDTLINSAKAMGVGRFKALAYEDMPISGIAETFDMAVANFSLLGDQSVHHVFRQVFQWLKPKNKFIVQTIHPQTVDSFSAQEGWLQGSWQGFSKEFIDPAPWYFRNLERWQSLFAQHGFKLITQDEPVNSVSRQLASIIFTAEKNCSVLNVV